MEFVSEQNEQVSFSITGCLEVEQVEQVIGIHSSQMIFNSMIGDVNTEDPNKSELRKEYEKTIELFNGFEILKNTYIKAAEEARENLEEFDSSQVYHVSVVEHDETKKTFKLKEKEVVVIGRLPKCDFNSSNNRVSRVNCVITIFNGRVMVFDFYSLFGTWIKQKVTLEGDNQKKFEKIQSVHKFNPGETTTLVIGESEPQNNRYSFTKIYISNRECMICYSNPRGITFKTCGHNTMCEECYETYSLNKTNVKCIICKTRNPVSSIQHVPCIHTNIQV